MKGKLTLPSAALWIALIAAPLVGIALVSALSQSTVAVQKTMPALATTADTTQQGGLDELTQTGVTIELRTHCDDLDPTQCSSFTVDSPTSLTTQPLVIGSVLSFDVVILNPQQIPLKRARVWLQYDPKYLQGMLVSMGQNFSAVHADEQDFDAEHGYVMMQAETDSETGTNVNEMTLAQVQFIIVDTPATLKTPVSFYDAQSSDPHTAIFSVDHDANVLSPTLGTLHVAVEGSSLPDTAQSTNQNSTETGSQVLEVTGSSVSSAQATSSVDPVLPTVLSTTLQSSAVSSAQSSTSSSLPSQRSVSSKSVSSLHPAAPTSQSSSAKMRSAFVLLQVQNVRTGTEGTSLYIAWDALPSPSLQGYHVYYGNKSGQYMQRRTVRPEDTSLAVRSLWPGTPYFVAVRGFNDKGEETSFSQEAGVTIGSPKTSTAPLSATLFGGPQGKNPLTATATNSPATETVPGAAGLSSTLSLLLLISAVAGTFFAFRRQLVATSRRP